MTEDAAKSALANAKLKWKSTQTTSDASKGAGVVAQSVSPKSVVDKDTEVTITINTYSALKQGTVYINVASLTGYTPQKEIDENGEEVTKDPGTVSLKVTIDGEQVESKTVKKDVNSVAVSFDGKGTVTVKVIIDGSTKATKSFDLNSQTEMTIQ